VVNETGNRIQILEVQILASVSISSVLKKLRKICLPIFRRLCLLVGNVVGLMPVAFETNRNYISDFTGVQILILAVLRF